VSHRWRRHRLGVRDAMWGFLGARLLRSGASSARWRVAGPGTGLLGSGLCPRGLRCLAETRAGSSGRGGGRCWV